MDLGDIEKPRETLNECQHHLDLLRQLRENSSWVLLCRYFLDSAEHVERGILSGAVDPAMIYQQEFMKGRANALRNIPNYLEEYCEELEGNINRIVSMMREEEEDESARPDPFDYRSTYSINGEPTNKSESESRSIVP